MKKLLMVLAFMLVALLPMEAASAEGNVAYVAVQEDSYLNGRMKPDRHSEAVAYFLRGDLVEVLDISGGWAKLEEGGEEDHCYVAIEYLRSSPELDSMKMQVTSDGRVRVRDLPGGKKVKAYLRDGDMVDVLLCFDGWAMTKSGWILMDYLREVKE